MKWKYYLRGFGVGIIFAAIMLSVLNLSTEKGMAEQEIIEQAKKLGMVDPNETMITAIETLVPTDKMTPVPTNEVQEEVATPTPIATAKETVKPKKSQEPVATAEVVEITIESGMGSGRVCQKLKELGVVDDAYSLDAYLCENGYSLKIRPGTYKINKGASYEEIAEALMK